MGVRKALAPAATRRAPDLVVPAAAATEEALPLVDLMEALPLMEAFLLAGIQTRGA